MKKKKNPYATVGMEPIRAPKNAAASDPKSDVRRGGDLRVKKTR